jgi:hypothetical protein
MIHYCERCSEYHAEVRSCVLYTVSSPNHDGEPRQVWATSPERAMVKWARYVDSRESEIVTDGYVVKAEWETPLAYGHRSSCVGTIRVVIEPEYSVG